MAAPNQPYSYREDVPEDVYEKIRLQRLQRKQIELLETRLEQLRRSNTMLEAELEPYRVARPQMQAQSSSLIIGATEWSAKPINRCPDEILVIIFDLCSWEWGRRQDIARLLQVCRLWNRLIMGTPMLWDTIELPGDTEWFDIVHHKALHSYITACMERSRGRPIEVKLSFDAFPDFEDYMNGVTMEAIRAFTDPNDHQEIGFALERPRWDRCQPTTYNNEVKETLMALVGENGVHIQRWISLDIDLPGNEALIEPLMDALAKHPPKLTKLGIYPFDSNNTREDQYPMWFRNLSLVEDLTISTYRPISILGISPAILHHLAIYVDDTYSNLKELSTFSALRSLIIWSIASVDDGQHSFTICLPRLHTLQIYGEYEGLSSLTWNIPVLTSLSISDWHPKHRIPRVSAYHIHLAGDVRPLVNEMSAGIYSTLSLSPRIQILTVTPNLRTAALRTIVRRQEKGEMISLYKLEVQRQERGMKEDIYLHERPSILALIGSADSEDL